MTPFQSGTAPAGAPDLLSALGEVIESPVIENCPFVLPPALGWWLLLAITLVITVFAVIKIKQHLAKRAEQRFLSAALTSLPTPNNQSTQEEKHQYIHALNRALKAIAIQKYGAKQVATLSGKEWLAFLDQSGQCNHFSQGAGQVFGASLYQREIPNPPDLAHLRELCQSWCKEVCS